MINSMLKRYIRRNALQHGKFAGLWRRFGKPSLEEWTEYLCLHGGFQGIGTDCAINPSVTFTDPAMTQLGRNVRIAGGIVLGHDGSVNMVNRAYGTTFDAVGPVVIADNVFVGIDSIVLPGTRIGPNTIIGAGSVVGGRLAGNAIYAGNPLRQIRTMEEHLEILKQRNATYPWSDLIATREGGFDPLLEPELRRQRIHHFFGDNST